MNAPRHGLMLALCTMAACGQVPSPALSQTAAAPASSSQLEKLVAPIALYPDPLVAQILPASTYPVQVVEAARALANGGRPDTATASQWDPSIQALVSYPTVLKMMSDKISWTTQLGQAVAANQSAVMSAIQQVRRQAQAAGNLQSNDKQVVSVQGTGDASTVIIQPANPQVIYVPQYNPVAILAPPPPYYFGNPGYGMLTFGVGFAAGAATAYACNWGYGYSSVTVNNYYHYNASNNYAAYHPSSGTYTGYNSKTGTYGAYNPATGRYGTYNPSTGAYNKNGQTGTWHPPSADDVGRSAGDYGASQYRASGGYGAGDPAAGSQYRGSDPSRGSGGGSLGDTGRLGGSWSGLGGQDFGDHGFGGGWNSGGSGWGGGARGYSSGGSFDNRSVGGDTFRGLGGGGWASRDASDRGFGSFGGGGFGGFRGGGFGGFRGGRR